MADANQQQVQQDPNQQQPQNGEKKKSLRWHMRQEKLKRVRDARPVKRVRVHPRDDVIRRDIKHGSKRFPAEGSVEWPLDQFTKRRLRDGTVRLENEQETKAREEQRAQDRHNGQRGKEQRPTQTAAAPQPPR
jgi:hypothetical protein